MICESGEKPVLMLDDLSSELDETHLAKVLKAGIDLVYADPADRNCVTTRY